MDVTIPTYDTRLVEKEPEHSQREEDLWQQAKTTEKDIAM